MKIAIQLRLGLFAFFFSQLALFAQAAPSSEQLPYYGKEFYQELSSGATDDSLKQALRKVLTSYHEKTKNEDRIVDHCNDDDCYSHISLGYDRARIFLMGVYHLIDHGNGNYAIYDVYCDKEKGSKDFGKNTGPYPNRIPDGNILNTEHTWPQSRFGGRDKEMQKADLHHLFPTDNQMNAVRGNNPFGEVVNDSKILKCPVSRTGRSADGGGEVFEPPNNHKGNVARALFYFSVRYSLTIDERQERTLRKWSHDDPVDEAEADRNSAVQKVQGNRNPFVDHPELSERIRDF